jgi:hypothetical protein
MREAVFVFCVGATLVGAKEEESLPCRSDRRGMLNAS